MTILTLPTSHLDYMGMQNLCCTLNIKMIYIILWLVLTCAEPPTRSAAQHQREWDSCWTSKVWTTLHNVSEQCTRPGDSSLVLPVTALGLHLSDEEIWIVVRMRLRTTLCESRDQRTPWSVVQKKHLQMLNDIIWKAFVRAKIPSEKEPYDPTT